MPIRITGLNSGLDTESIISALVSSYSYKTSKYKKAQTKKLRRDPEFFFMPENENYHGSRRHGVP